jgi:hypothetical protein
VEGVGPWDLFLWSVSNDYRAVSRGQLVPLGYVSLQGTVKRYVWAAVRHSNGVRFLLPIWVAVGRGKIVVTGVVVFPVLRPSESNVYRITKNCCRICICISFYAIMGYEIYASSFVCV